LYLPVLFGAGGFEESRIHSLALANPYKRFDAFRQGFELSDATDIR